MSDSHPVPNSYADLRKLVSPESYNLTLAYLSWHNRLPMTEMLTTWQALVVALAADRMALDQLFFDSIKGFFEASIEKAPTTVGECRDLASRLAKNLSN